MKLRSRFLGQGFFLGVWFACLLLATIQDWLGLEGYISHIRAYWIHVPWWFWLPIWGLWLVVMCGAIRLARMPD